MANTWDMAFVNIAKEGISTFGKALPSIGVMATDFSDQIMDGISVKTRVINGSGEAVDRSVGYDHATVAAGEAPTPKTITLDQDKILGFDITDDEILSNSKDALQDSIRRTIALKVNKLAYGVVQHTYGKIVAASYTNKIVVGDKAAFDWDNAMDIATTLETTYDFPLMTPGAANLVLNTAYHGALVKDARIANKSASGLDVIVVGGRGVPEVAGMGLVKGYGMPDNSQNLVGIACTRDALAIAMRGKPSTNLLAEVPGVLEYVEVMKDEISGVVLTAYAFRQPGNRGWRYTFEAWYGALATYTGALVRLTSA